MLTLIRNMLRDLRQKVQRFKHLKIPLHPRLERVVSLLGKRTAPGLSGTIKNLAGLGYLDNPRETKRAAGDVLDEPLHPGSIIGSNIDGIVDTKAGVLPPLHAIHHFRGNALGLEQKRKDLLLPNHLKSLRRNLIHRNELAALHKNPAGDYRMDMWVKVDEITEGLNSGDHSRKAFFVIDLLKKNISHRLPCGMNETAQKSSIVSEVYTKPFRNGEHKLAVGHLGKNILAQVVRQKQGAFLMAGGAATPLPTGECNEHFVAALLALNPGKPLLEIAALFELVY